MKKDTQPWNCIARLRADKATATGSWNNIQHIDATIKNQNQLSMMNIKPFIGDSWKKPECHIHAGMAIFHDTWQACHQVLFFLLLLLACSDTDNQCDSPIVSTSSRGVHAYTMDHQLVFHQMRIYNVESIYPLHIQFSRTVPHKLWNLIVNTKLIIWQELSHK